MLHFWHIYARFIVAPRVISLMWPRNTACRVLHATCCMLHVVRCMLSVAWFHVRVVQDTFAKALLAAAKMHEDKVFSKMVEKVRCHRPIARASVGPFSANRELRRELRGGTCVCCSVCR